MRMYMFHFENFCSDRRTRTIALVHMLTSGPSPALTARTTFCVLAVLSLVYLNPHDIGTKRKEMDLRVHIEFPLQGGASSWFKGAAKFSHRS